MANEMKQTTGGRQGAAAYRATGAAPEVAAAIEFTDQAGNAITTLDTASAHSLLLKCVNADAADAITISYRVKCHPDDDEFTEVTTHTGTANVTTLDALSVYNGDAIPGYQMQIWWSNATGAGAASSEISVVLKG